MLKEDTKVDLELSGEIDSSQERNSPGKSSLLGGMSLPVPINISQTCSSASVQHLLAPIQVEHAP